VLLALLLRISNDQELDVASGTESNEEVRAA
jgi:hypothetical protein